MIAGAPMLLIICHWTVGKVAAAALFALLVVAAAVIAWASTKIVWPPLLVALPIGLLTGCRQ